MNPKKEKPAKSIANTNPATDITSPDAEGSVAKPVAADLVTGSSSLVTVSAGNAVIEHGGSALAENEFESSLTLNPNDIVHVIISPDSSPLVVYDLPQRARYAPLWEVSKLILVPVGILMSMVVGIVILGLAQKTGWIQSGTGGSTDSSAATTDSAVSYICPMMCVPPQRAPGRCPVCAMELVVAASGSSSGPSSSIQIDSRSRRVSGIQTTVARSSLLTREIRGVGEISYDESKLKTISAYIDGRVEELFADFTGVEVKQGDSLALLYSPELYAAQVEYLQSTEAARASSGSSSTFADSNNRLQVISRERLVELGMTETQILQLEQDKTANRRLELHAPMSGTVIEKMAVTGQYLMAGTPVYRLADLTSVWLVLELFPEDASAIQIGQPVVASTQSRPNDVFEGKVEFIAPMVDPKTRTVGIRVAIANSDGRLKPGEFARATLKVPVVSIDGKPRESVVIPRNSLLSVGQHSLAYVETKPGEYQLRKVIAGPAVDNLVAILSGISAGENVVSQSTFLLDAQMQLQGNPSLIDPDKMVMPEINGEAFEEIRFALATLNDEDRNLAEQQVICPVTEFHLGSMGMGTPIKLDINGKPVFICCEGCRKQMLEGSEKYFKILEDYAAGKSSPPESNANSHSGQVPPADGELPKMSLPKMKLPGEK